MRDSGVWLDAKSGVLTALQMLRTVFMSFRCGILFAIFRSQSRSQNVQSRERLASS
jgi:hypothetical protein